MVADTPDITPVLQAADTIERRIDAAIAANLREYARHASIGDPMVVRARLDGDTE